ncbi:hypothetical protein JXA88_11650 [Candidatus Fermentibacteria bacterium]|nr:hypothetical protein [Candidatus Fermentibacteria bacterium]
MAHTSALRMCAGLALVSLITAFPTEARGSGITAVVDEELGVIAARPSGWTEYPPRVYRRAPGTDDPSTFIQRRCAPGMTPDEIVATLPSFGALMEPAGCCRTEWCAWDLYRAEPTVWGLGRLVIEAALTELDGTVFITLLQASAQDYPALRETVLAPALATMKRTPTTDPAQPSEEPEDAAFPLPGPLVAR